MDSQPKKKKNWLSIVLRFAIPLIISVGLCWLLFRDFDFGEMWRVIRTECRFEWFAFGVVFAVLAQVFRAMRWRIQLRAIGVTPGLFPLILSIFGTYAVNLVFPRLGEVWRTGYIAQRQKASFTSVFGSMVADRLADTVSVALILVFTFIVASGSIVSYLAQNEATYESLRSLALSPWLWGTLVAGIAFVWWFMRWRTANTVVTRIQKAVRELWGGFIAIFSMPHKGKWLLLTAGIWLSYFTQFYLGMYAFGFTEALLQQHGWTVALVAFVLSSISMGVPSNGGIGPWQWTVMFSLGIYGLGEVPGAVFANMQLGITTLLTIVLGLFTFICIAIDRHKNSKQPTKNTEG